MESLLREKEWKRKRGQKEKLHFLELEKEEAEEKRCGESWRAEAALLRADAELEYACENEEEQEMWRGIFRWSRSY